MKKGFTLIEVLVSSLILFIGITGVMSSFVFCKKIIRRNTHKFNATTIINQNFEEIQRRVTWAQVEVFIADFANGKHITVKKEVDQFVPQDYFLECDASEILNPSGLQPIRKITARVSWDNEYVPKNSDNSVFMSIYTNDPY